MLVEVRMPHDGDMTMDLSGSNFAIASIKAYDQDSNELADADPSASVLTVHDLHHAVDYWFVVEGADGVTGGSFELIISCSSDEPTQSPTNDPTPAPTGQPTPALSIKNIYMV